MSTPGPLGAPPINHHWEAGPDDAKRLASAVVRSTYLQLRNLIPQVIVFVFAVLLFAGSGDFLEVKIWAAFIVVAILVIQPLIVLRRVRKFQASDAFPGARWAVGYGPTSLVIYQPTSSMVINYWYIDSVTVASGDTVILRFANTLLYHALPGELCPPAALSFLTEAIALGKRGLSS